MKSDLGLDLRYWIERLAPLGLVLALVVGVWALGGYWIRDNGWFCGVRNSDGTTVTLPSEPMLVEELERHLKDQSGCATLTQELTVTGTWQANTVIAPLGQVVRFAGDEAIRVRVEASASDFWLECGDFTGHRASNFPSFDGDRRACDPAIETRCRQDDALVLCEEIGDRGQRCLSAEGHVGLACDDSPDVCLDADGRFVGCDP